MIEPATRNAPLAQALADETIGVVLLDVILGWGSHPDPAGEVARVIADRPTGGPVIVASVTGTEADPQVRSIQARKLDHVGVLVAPSNAAATTIAFRACSNEGDKRSRAAGACPRPRTMPTPSTAVH